MPVFIRPGAERDLPALTAIYNHYVVETAITFDIEPFTVETRRPWFEAFAETGRYRLFVAEEDETVGSTRVSASSPSASTGRSATS